MASSSGYTSPSFFKSSGLPSTRERPASDPYPWPTNYLLDTAGDPIFDLAEFIIVDMTP